MSGTASIGKRLSCHAPRAEISATTRMTAPRARTEKAINLFMVAALRVAEFSLQQEGVAGGDRLAGGQAGDDLGAAGAALADRHGTGLEALGRAEEDHVAAVDR